jgi:hypothetical protein
MEGPIEFYDGENANLVETVDVWWMINHYENALPRSPDEAQPQALPLRNGNGNAGKVPAGRHQGAPQRRLQDRQRARTHKAMLDQYCVSGTYVGPSEEESPWVPFGDNAAIRHLAFDVRNNVYANVLWIKSPGVIGTHKHRGMVWAIGLEGSFRYLEYDWVCRPGDFITEFPGHRAHAGDGQAGRMA